MISNLYALDTDMDGIEDTIDQCPNTLITDLVDIRGCSLDAVKSEHKVSINIGASISQFESNSGTSEYYSSTLQVGYAYKKYSANISMGHGWSNSYNGLNDTMLSVGYNFSIMKNLQASVGVGVIFPSRKTSLNNNNTDYLASFNTTYTIDRFNLFAGYSFMKNNDDDVINIIENQNTNALNIGVGYYIGQKVYVSGSYNISNSTSKGAKDIEQASLFTYYSFTKNWSTNLTYSYGLSSTASNHSLSLNVGYAF
jgi:long-subunit fatty acid transport protein